MQILAARTRLTCLAVVTALFLPGCAMYSETRHKQGVAAKDAWKKVDLAGQLSAARKEEAALLAEQLRTEDALKRTSRDTTALAMVLEGAIEGSLYRRIKEDLGLLSGKNWAQEGLSRRSGDEKMKRMDVLLIALDDVVKEEKFLGRIENEFARFGLEMPGCKSIEDATADASLNEWISAHSGVEGDFIRNAWTEAKTSCSSLKTTRQTTATLLDGALNKSMKNIETAAEEIELSRADSLNQRNAYRAAAKSLDTAQKELHVKPNEAQVKVDAALERLQTLSSALQKLPDAFSSKIISDARIKSLNDLISSVEKARETGKTPAEATVAAKFLTQFPDLVDRAKVALADAEKPRLAPLVLMKNLEKVKADAAARDVETQQTKAKLLKDKFNGELERLRALRDSYDYLTYNCEGCLKWTLSEAVRPLDEKQLLEKGSLALVDGKARVLKSASLYLDSKGRLAASATKIQYQINALERERALAYAESNIAQWNTLISSVVDQMSDFGDIGIKKEDISKAVSSAALLLIGIGVN